MFIRLLLFVPVWALVFAAPSFAALKLKADDGTYSVVAIDNGANDSNPVASWIDFSGNLDTSAAMASPWTVSLDALANPLLSQPWPHMDLNGITLNSAAPGTVTLLFTQTDFPTSVPGLSAAIGGTVAAGGTLDLNLYADATNAEFGMGELVASSPTFTGGAFSWTGGGSSVATQSTPFSMTLEVIISHTLSSNPTSFDVEMQALPEPTSIALMGLGTLLAGFGVRRRRKKAAELVA